MQNLKSIKEKILSARDIVVAGHINPDGDSLGSLLSLGLGLKKLGRRVYFLSPDGVPKRYSRLPGAGQVMRKLRRAVDLAVAVDCSNREILGEAWGIFQKANNILEIDHHEFRRPFGNIRLVDTRAAAVGELIYPLLKNLKVNIDRNIAQNLLTSVVVETDSFRLPNVRPLTFEICYELMRKKVDFYSLVDMVFWSKTKQAAILFGISMARCKFLKDSQLVWSIVRQKDFRSQRGKDEDVDPVADEMRSIKGVKIVVFFREKDNLTLRVSLRSKGKINVAGIAERFGGGGHFDVAGCYIPNDPKVMQKLLSMAEGLLR